MSIDRYYATDGEGGWQRLDFTHVGLDETTGVAVPHGQWALHRTDFWVDLCHGNCLIDERYYFPDLASALEFYTEGWKERQCEDHGIDHMGLYSQGKLIHGHSIHGDAIGHEGENLKSILQQFINQGGEL